MLAIETGTEAAMPLIRKVIEVIGRHYPQARWAVSEPLDENYVVLHVFLDLENSWRVQDLIRPLIAQVGESSPPILVFVRPAMVADLPEVFTAPVVSGYSSPE